MCLDFMLKFFRFDFQYFINKNKKAKHIFNASPSSGPDVTTTMIYLLFLYKV